VIRRLRPGAANGTMVPMRGPYTPLQGQFLAFIYYYTKVNRQPPAEADMAAYFGRSPASVHDMLVRLEQMELVKRPTKPRSIRLLIERCELPDLL
jgi:DNA-binding MarR family transcriptional regulator